MGARSFDDEIAQVISQDRANWYFPPNRDMSWVSTMEKSREILIITYPNNTGGFD